MGCGPALHSRRLCDLAQGVGVVARARVRYSVTLQHQEASLTSEARKFKLAVGALLPATYALLVFGSTVRAHGAGLACPDWPLCFGEVIPQLDFQIFLEWGHRALAGGIALVWGAIGLALWRSSLWVRFRTLFAVGSVLLVVQIILGGLTVLRLLAEWTVTSHLLGGNSFCALLLVFVLALREAEAPQVRAAVNGLTRPLAGLLVAFAVAQLALGGLVSSSGAGLACGTWPGCNGPVWFPTFEGPIGLQVTHRLMAYSLLGLAAVNALVSGVRTASILVLALICAQVALGVANVLWQIPVEVTVAHAGGAAAILLSITWLNVEAWRSPLAVASPSGTRSAVEGA